ncbi:MAG: Ig-like domain-containing protein [Candidatus Eremiobacterota bacterium]
MQKKIYLLLLFILITIVFLSNCGGNDTITQPVSLSTPATNTLNNTGYIVIRIVWPNEDTAGNYTFSSPDNKSLTASMTKDTYGINIKIVAYDDPNSILADENFMRVNNEPVIERKIGDLPVIKVKVSLTAYQLYPGTVIDSKDYVFNIKTGQNTLYMPLGDYSFKVIATKPNITLPYYFNKSNNNSSKIAGSTPTPVAINGKTGNIMIANDYPYPPEPPTPSETPCTDIVAQLMITYSADANGVVPEAKPVAYKPVNFQLQGEGSLSSTWGTTDPNGYCVVSFIPTLEGTDTITANFYPDPNDPNTVYTDSCTVNVIRDNTPPETTATPEPTSVPTIPEGPVLVWKEDFETYAPGSWPENWITMGESRTNRVNNCIVSYGGNQTLQLHGTDNSASASRVFTGPPCEVTYSIRISDDEHDSTFEYSDSMIGIRSPNYSKPLLDFYAHMKYINDDPNFPLVEQRDISIFTDTIGEYYPDTWYRVTIRFYVDGRVKYWLNGQLIAVTYNDSPYNYLYYFEYLYFFSYHCTVWIDDIEVYHFNGPDWDNKLK